jgi:hypothetical protein
VSVLGPHVTVDSQYSIRGMKILLSLRTIKIFRPRMNQQHKSVSWTIKIFRKVRQLSPFLTGGGS